MNIRRRVGHRSIGKGKGLFGQLLPLLVLTALPGAVNAQFSYTVDNGSASITGYSGADTEVIIPETIDGFPVTSVAGFGNHTNIVTVIVPDSVTRIADRTFENCTSLMNVSIGNGITTIGSLAFYRCSRIAGISIPDSTVSIGDRAFSGCANLKEIVVAPGNTTYSSLDGVLFNQDQSVLVSCPQGRNGSYAIPNTVLRLAAKSFNECTDLTDIDIPHSVTDIGEGAFYYCTGLREVTIPNSVTNIGNWAFQRCSLMNYVSIGSSVTSIGQLAFSECSSLNSIVIPDSTTSLGDAAFMYCTRLTNITFGSSVTGLGYQMFVDCTALRTIDIPDGVASVGDVAFAGCISLANVNFGSGITNIGTSPFLRCGQLGAITVSALNPFFSSSDGVLFNKSMTELILCPAGKIGTCEVPESVTSVRAGAFTDCTKLTAMMVDALNPAFSSSDGVLFNKSMTELILCPAGKMGTCEIPESVTSVRAGAFTDCTKLTAITVHELNQLYRDLDGVLFDKGVGNLIKYPAGRTGAYTIPDGVENISATAFQLCRDLSSVTIPASVTGLAFYAFSECVGLTGAYFEGHAPSITLPWESLRFHDCPAVIIYYRTGTSGWRRVFDGHPTAVWIEPPNYSEWLPSSGLLTQHPAASAEDDDPDQDNMANYSEMLAGTDPTDSASALMLERESRPNDLTAEDQIALVGAQYALYLQSVPGKSYGFQWSDSTEGPWNTTAVVTASTTQMRLVFNRPTTPAFYRVILAQ